MNDVVYEYEEADGGLNALSAPEKRQRFLNQPQEDDDRLVDLTVLQATKCANIVDAYQKGHPGYDDAVRAVVDLLRAVAIGASPYPAVIRPSISEAWAVVKAAPWPMPGSPR